MHCVTSSILNCAARDSAAHCNYPRQFGGGSNGGRLPLHSPSCQRRRGNMHPALRAVLDFVLPPCCLVCGVSTSGAPIPWVCQHCWGTVGYVTLPICAQCGQPLAA